MTALRAQYAAYIAAINGGRALSPYVHDQVTHNGQSYTTAQYEAMIRASQKDLPGLHFETEMVAVDSPQASESHSWKVLGTETVAVRLKLSWKPPEEGEEDTFYEHVFYNFFDGKISRVWSLLDGAGMAWREKREKGRGGDSGSV